jgi:hypothetical protein
MEVQVPVILVDSNSSEEEEVAAANVTKRKYEEYRQISDLSGFDNLRAMIEAEASMRRNRRERRKRKKMMKKQTVCGSISILFIDLFFVMFCCLVIGKEGVEKMVKMLGDGTWQEDLGDLAIINYNP